MHRVRQGFVAARTAQANQIRGLLAELGIVLPKGIRAVRNQLMERIDQVADRLPGVFLELMRRLHEHFVALDRQVTNSKARSSNGTAIANSAKAWKKFPGLAPSPLPLWLHRLPMRVASRMAGNWPLGWA